MMPAPSKMALLPDAIREEFNRQLVANGFGNYDGLTAWLREHGYEISRAAVGRYGQAFKEKLGALRQATEQARIIMEESPDDEGALGEALTRLAQEKIFSVLLELEVDTSKIDLAKLTKSVADLARSSVAQKKWQVEIREKAMAAAEEATEIAKKGGLTDEAAAEIRAKILGIAS